MPFCHHDSASVLHKQEKYIKLKSTAASLQYQLLQDLAILTAPWDRGMHLHPLLYKCPETSSSEY